MKLTEKILVAGFTGLTNGGDLISEVNGQTIIWNYRTDYESRTDGYAPVSSPKGADAIYLEQRWPTRIALRHTDRADFSAIVKALDTAVGTSK